MPIADARHRASLTPDPRSSSAAWTTIAEDDGAPGPRTRSMTTLILGGSSFLAQHIARALEQDGQRVVATARQASGPYEIRGVDVLDANALDHRWWEGRLAPVLDRDAPVVGIVNLITRKSGDQSLIDDVNVRAVEAMGAARRALSSQGRAPLTLHMGSVGEYRQSEKASGYVSGKRAARAASARWGSVDLILTLGPVTGRTRRTRTSESLRRALRMLPQLRSSVSIGVSPATEVGDAVAALMRHGRRLVDEFSRRPIELVLAGRAISWGRYLDLPDRERGWGGYEPWLWRPLAALEGARSQWIDRVGSMARIAHSGTSPGADHYWLTANRGTILEHLSTQGGIALGDWRVVACDFGAGQYLIKS